MFRAAKELRALMDRIAFEGRMHPAEMTETMKLARLLLEASGEQSSYETLTFYCDWFFHNKIERRKKLGVLVDLGKLIQANRDDVQAIIRGLPSAMGIPTLRDDMIRLFGNQRIDTRICVVDANWSMFIGILLRKLVGYPVEFPFGKWWEGQEGYEELKKKLKSFTPFMPVRVEILDVDERFPVVEVVCDAHGWGTDKEHYIKLRFDLPHYQ
jgi:hypothetical protein